MKVHDCDVVPALGFVDEVVNTSVPDMADESNGSMNEPKISDEVKV